MDFTQAQIDILNWVVNFVEKSHPNLDGWAPCPHARMARLSGQFEIRPGQLDPYSDLMHVDLEKKMVIAYVYEPQQLSSVEFNQQIDRVNQGFLLARNIIALADHPYDIEEVKGVRMNQGQWAIAFVQPLDKLNQFAKTIADKGYYKGWSEEYLASLFKFRQDPRS